LPDSPEMEPEMEPLDPGIYPTPQVS